MAVPACVLGLGTGVMSLRRGCPAHVNSMEQHEAHARSDLPGAEESEWSGEHYEQWAEDKEEKWVFWGTAYCGSVSEQGAVESEASERDRISSQQTEF